MTENTPDDFAARRGDAWELGSRGDYDAALNLIDELLTLSPVDLITLRMKGNLLELKALDLNEYKSKKLMTSREYLFARECYEQILRADPRNTVALIDLGDHYKNLDAYDKAFSYYEQAVTFLGSGESRMGRIDEIEELMSTCAELRCHEHTEERARRLKLACEELLNRKT